MNQIKQIHAQSIRTGIDQTKSLVQQLLQIPDIDYATKLFNLCPDPSIFLYNKLIQAYSSHNQPHRSLHLFKHLCFNGFLPNQHTFTFMFAASASMSSQFPGRMLHAGFFKSGFESDSFCSTALVDMYAKLGMLRDARKVFDEMRERDIPTWNALITGYSRCGDMKKALECFELMPEKNIVSWTAVISGFSQNGNYTQALNMFLRMEKDKSVKPNHVTISSVLPACANLGALEIGQRIEVYARGNGYFDNVFVSNAILELYARCGKIDEAKRVFSEIGKRRNLCSWNSMIVGLAIHGECDEALEYYSTMLREGTKPDDVTFVGLLLACVHGGMITKGREVFESMEKIYHITPKLEHYGCMIDLLGRAGKLTEAYDLITRMPMKPDAVVWGTLLGACSFYANVEIGEVAAEELYKLEPLNPGNYVIMSNIYALNGKWDDVAKLRKMMKCGRITKSAGYSFVEEGGEVHKFVVEDKSHVRSDEIYEILNGILRVMKLEKRYPDFEDELAKLRLSM